MPYTGIMGPDVLEGEGGGIKAPIQFLHICEEGDRHQVSVPFVLCGVPLNGQPTQN
jgi:hypothetical protein